MSPFDHLFYSVLLAIGIILIVKGECDLSYLAASGLGLTCYAAVTILDLIANPR